ncbi:uncharacterized protein isoform X2 [Choristoneura fumiferana]|uniref:uncharacterized protein isoform X2 n=1 Tax=Choristoneura fumiferana TaxID=7141 RepID=UPI003D15ED8A
MKGELPVFKRCCFCLPLRRGLVGWGYLRLALDVLAIIRFVFICIEIYSIYIGPVIFEKIMCTATTIYYCIDALFAVFLIVGGHKKSYKLLRISYIYCIVWLALILIIGGLIAYSSINWIQREEHINLYKVKYIALDSAITFSIIFLQVYLILLTRSEEIKLRKENLGVQFVNNAAEAEPQCVRLDNLNGA